MREFCPFIEVRLFMDTIEEGNIPPVVFFRDGFICRQHEVFYDLVGFLADDIANFPYFPVGMKEHFRFRKVEVQTASFYPLLAEQTGEGTHL